MFSSSTGTGTGTGTGTAPAADQSAGQRPDADRVFGDVFEDVCPPPPNSTRATIIGSLSTISYSGQRSSGISLCGLGWVQRAALV
jgi:hypothetical protein